MQYLSNIHLFGMKQLKDSILDSQCLSRLLAVQLNRRCIEQSVQESSVSQACIKTFFCFSSARKHAYLFNFF